MKRKLHKALMIFTVSVFSAITAAAQIAGNPPYTLDQAAIAGGGGKSTGSTYTIESTIGLPVAGITSSGGNYSTQSGFWLASPLAPTAAGVSVRGQVLGVNGGGLRNATVTLSGGTLITPLKARTGSFGYFTFGNVPSGHVYVLSVESRRYRFGQESQVIWVNDSIADIIFQAAWEN